MADFKAPMNDETKQLRDAFVAEDIRKSLLLGDDPSAVRTTGAAALYQQVADGSIDWNGLSEDGRSAAIQMERGLAAIDFGYAIAAADAGPIPRRKGDYEVTFQTSESDPDLTYIIIRGVSLAPGKLRSLIIHSDAGRRVSLNLPEERRGVVQVLIENNSELYSLLCDPDTSLLLR